MEPEAHTPERRSGPGRRAEDRGERLRGFAAGVLALCGALSILYFIFAALGAVDLGDAAVGSAIALVLGLLWVIGAWQRSRSGGGFATRGDRERRGF
jgi:hypothetical protein